MLFLILTLSLFSTEIPSFPGQQGPNHPTSAVRQFLESYLSLNVSCYGRLCFHFLQKQYRKLFVESCQYYPVTKNLNTCRTREILILCLEKIFNMHIWIGYILINTNLYPKPNTSVTTYGNHIVRLLLDPCQLLKNFQT